MNVTMQVSRSDGNTVYVADTGHYYSCVELDRVIRVLQVAREWKTSEDAYAREAAKDNAK